MSLPYIQSTMSSVRAGGDSFISRPFLEDGDTSTKVYNMACSQLADDYDSEQLALNDTMTSAGAAGVIALPFAADSKAYFVGDTGHTAADGGMIEFQRTFANIPKPTRLPSGSQNYSFPGWTEPAFSLPSLDWIAIFENSSVQREITGMTYTWPSTRATITTERGHLLTASDSVFVNLSYTASGGTKVSRISSWFTVLSAPTANTIEINLGLFFADQQFLTVTGGVLQSSTLDIRGSISKNSPTITQNVYILPGITPEVDTIDDISLPPVFSIMDTKTGEEVSVASSETLPTKSDYKSTIANQGQIIIESSMEKWMGNIIKQTIKTIRAI